MIATLIFIGLLVVVTIQVAVLLGVYLRLFSLSNVAPLRPDLKRKDQHAPLSISVIICAKNEELNLKSFLPKVLKQNYRLADGSIAFEVIVVNDCSEDATSAVLGEMTVAYPHLKIITIEATESRIFPGKKFALSRGIAAASSDWIVCTDADCEPASDVWLRHLVAPFKDGKRIIAGYGACKKEQGLLNAFIRYETMHTYFSLYAFARAGLPYMAVGRNMAFIKDVFKEAEAHPTWKKLPSGDDDLLVALCATKENFEVVTHPDSFTWSEAKRTVKDYIVQKQRHVSTGKYYPKKTKFLLGLFAMSIALWWPFLALFLVFYFPNKILLLGCFILPVLCYSTLLSFGAKQLRERTYPLGWFAFLLCWTIYNAVLAPFILWKNKMRWK